MKRCPKCDTVKLVTEFHRKLNGRAGWCRVCTGEARRAWYAKPGNAERVKENAREYSIKNRDKEFDRNLKRMYGLSRYEYYGMLIAQVFKCAICGVTFGEQKAIRPHVDHDHSTGKVRGLLCSNCNFAIGLVRDDANVLRTAATYVENGGFICDETLPK